MKREGTKSDTLMRDVLTTQEAAQFLRCSRQWLEISRVRGSGPPFAKVGRLVRYRRTTLEQWLHQRERRSTSEGPDEKEK